MIQGYRESDVKINIKVNRSEKEAIDRADAATDLATKALKKGMEVCGKGKDCCLSVDPYDSIDPANRPTHTFEISCTDEDNCDTRGIEAAENEIVGAVREIVEH